MQIKSNNTNNNNSNNNSHNNGNKIDIWIWIQRVTPSPRAGKQTRRQSIWIWKLFKVPELTSVLRYEFATAVA